MKKLLILLAGLAIIAIVAVAAIIMQMEDHINPTIQTVNAVNNINTSAALPQLTAAPDQAPAGTEMLLDCADADMAITILDGYTLQEVTSDAYHKGSKYVFVNPQTGVTFSVQGTLEEAQSQSKILNTVRGDQNNAVAFDHTQVGDFRYLIHHASDCNWIWSFCMLTDSGFSYRFWFEFPVNRGQDAIPQDALAMLSSIRLMEKAPAAVQGITYELEVEDAMITLTLPSEYEMLPIERRETNPLPERYEFMNTATGSKLGLQSSSDNQKNQDIFLSKLHDPENKWTSFSLTCNTYQTWAYFHYDNREHGFYVIADNGYAYNFYLYLPEGQGQNSPPEEALKILETMQITGK